MNLLTSLMVTVATWLQPQPTYAIGMVALYGDQYLVEANAKFRGYDLQYYYKRCGVSSISPVHLGQIAWLKSKNGNWLGPCLLVDVVARRDWYQSVVLWGEVAEVPGWLALELGWTERDFKNMNVKDSLVYFGSCPPNDSDVWEYNLQPRRFNPPYEFETDLTVRTPNFVPYPQQQLEGCGLNLPKQENE